MVTKAGRALQGVRGRFLTRQFENEANPDMISRTSLEIIDDFKGSAARLLGHRCMGRAARSKACRGSWQRSGPTRKSSFANLEDAQLSGQRDHAAAQPGRIRGRGPPHRSSHIRDAGLDPDFIPETYRPDAVDSGCHRSNPAGLGRRCCAAAGIWLRSEGDLCGHQRGATFAGALRVCADATKGATILCMLPDTGERYF